MNKSSKTASKKVNCSYCGKSFYIKFVIPRQTYSQKNNLGHWTKKPQDQDKEWCNKCLLALYYNKPFYWSMVNNLKRRQQLRKYVYDGKFLT